ncbi:hypothetical protein [Collinsella sp. AM33-4BH]|uniref:hypothetical protein n=1 Tax=Collinsella sp. AM33-4BH TaxID=2292315 RepID=UPI000E4760DA|nr:hypothetical protein [Collinsella sp. AM33-4BH]RHC95182.1 hypothetical protein DW821_04440 [Collinsella sp. AM33-4BH]
MAKPVELYKGNAGGRCPVDVYLREEDEEVKFTDLRTLVDYSILNYTSETSTALERLACYKLSGDFDLDCSKTSAKRYSFKPVQDMYEVLWPVDEYPRDIVDSAETLVSASAAFWRCKTENQPYIKSRKIDWDSLRVEASEAEYDDELNDLNDFAHAVATIGNFMPVPSGHQSFLRYSGERYDLVLKKIWQHYCDSSKDEDEFFCAKKNLCWLDCFDGWNGFVDKNYLKGSFVDDGYQIVAFDNTFRQLSEMLENRSRAMHKEYEKRLEGSQRSATA